jgi:7tm Odorant receptor
MGKLIKIVLPKIKEPAFFGRVLTYIIPTTLQILLPCYFASILSIASEKLSMSLFHSNWMQESREFKMAMKIFMENVKKPLRITAFGVFHVSLTAFIAILNSAFSLYAVLKTMGSKI